MITKTKPAGMEVARSWWKSKVGSAERTQPFPQGSNTITYENGPSHLNGRPIWKPCIHTWQNRIVETPYVYHTPNEDPRYSETGSFSMLALNISQAHLSVGTPANVSMGNAVRNFTNEVYGAIPKSFLALESLAGLLGGKSIIKTSSEVLRAVTQFFGDVSFKQAMQLLKAAAGFDLGRKFSVQSSVNDIVAGISLCEGYVAYCDKLSRRHDMPRRYRVTTRNANRAAAQLNPPEWSGYSTWGQCYSTPIKFSKETVNEKSVTIFGEYNVHYPQSFWSRSNYYISRLGLDRPMSTIWAIIPMSFVLDYFVSVQTLMDELDNELNRSLVNVIALGPQWVCSNTSLRTTWRLPSGVCGYNGGRTYPLGTHAESGFSITTGTFIRKPLDYINLRDAWSETSDLTLHQQSTLSELALQLLL